MGAEVGDADSALCFHAAKRIEFDSHIQKLIRNCNP